MKKIVYVDMDNVLVDFKSAIGSLSEAELKQYEHPRPPRFRALHRRVHPLRYRTVSGLGERGEVSDWLNGRYSDASE